MIIGDILISTGAFILFSVQLLLFGKSYIKMIRSYRRVIWQFQRR